jgi:glycosyltransferase involved in cell wall biosynthesis
VDDDALRHRLIEGGREVAGRYTWEACARRHLEVYAALTR